MDPMNDAALEREIERALAVDPSPEFLVRVRARIADEPAAARGFGWLFASIATAAAAAAAVVLAMRMVSPAGQPASVGLLASRSIGSAIAVPPGSPAKAGHYVPSASGQRDRTHYAVSGFSQTSDVTSNVVSGFSRTSDVASNVVSGFSRTSKSRSPEPFFDTHETTALQRLIANVRDARVDLTPLAKEGPMPLPAMDPLVISPIVIEPLASGGLEGERP